MLNTNSAVNSWQKSLVKKVICDVTNNEIWYKDGSFMNLSAFNTYLYTLLVGWKSSGLYLFQPADVSCSFTIFHKKWILPLWYLKKHLHDVILLNHLQCVNLYLLISLADFGGEFEILLIQTKRHGVFFLAFMLCFLKIF